MSNKSIFLSILFLSFLLPIFAENNPVNSFFDRLTRRPEFTCSLSIIEITQLDTIENSGFLAVGKNKFYANIGDDYYLRVNTGEMLTWSEGADAYPIDGLPFFDFIKLKDKLIENFKMTVEKNSEKICIYAKCKNDGSSVNYWEFCVDSNFIPQNLKLQYSRGNILNIDFFSVLYKSPADTIFELPKGVSVIR
ncbi:hypothetical protein J7L68_09970 [bacterium]|nr:hypothetical protein [bacterium]